MRSAASLRGGSPTGARTYRLLPCDRVSLNTLAGRVVCRMLPGERQQAMLVDPDWKIGGAELVWREGTYYLHLTQTSEAPAALQASACGGPDACVARVPGETPIVI